MQRSEITQSNNIRCLTASDTAFIDICFVLRHNKMINGQPNMTRHSLHVTTFKFYQNFYSEFVNIMNFCGALWIQKILFSVYSKVVNHTRTLDDTSSRRSSRLRIGALVPCPLGPGSVVGIATGYGLDGPGIESRWGGVIFRTCPDRS